jgi:hypothetical protein
MRRLFWRLYDRFFDRVDEPFQFDPSAVEWIREHEPRRLVPLFGATQRNARRLRQLGWIVIGLSVLTVLNGIWLAQPSPALQWFQGGFLLGLGWMLVAGSYLFAQLALLRGERSDRPRRLGEEAPAR